MELNPLARADAEQHFIDVYPREGCGVVIKGTFYPCINAHPQPTEHFTIGATELLELSATHGAVEAVLHSHPIHKSRIYKWPAEWPSQHDQEQCLKGSVPWGIVSTDGENLSDWVWIDDSVIAQLEGREFQHGIYDCYSIVRDYYRLNQGVTLPYYPRQMDWWLKGENLYLDNFKSAGFAEINIAEATTGDVLLIQVGSPVPNHAAVLIDPHTILHHLWNRLSAVDSFARWRRHVVKVLRYGSQN